VVNKVVDLLNRPELRGAMFVLDETGVGVAVADLFEARTLRPDKVTITGGIDATSNGHSHRVPKRDLASAVEVLLESRRLAIDEALPLAQVLTSELANFKVKVSPAGHDSYGAGTDWRENSHDDLVLAVALACWFGEQPSREMWRGRA